MFPKHVPGTLKKTPSLNLGRDTDHNSTKLVCDHPLVPGLTIEDCAGSFNNFVPRGTKLSAIDVTAKALFEHLYLVLGLSPFEPRVNCPYAPTPPPLTQQLFLDFRAFFLPCGPLFFVSTRFTNNLAKSRYPQGGYRNRDSFRLLGASC